MEDQWHNFVSFLLSLCRLPDQLSLTSMLWILWYLILKRLTWIASDRRPFSPFQAAQTLNLISTLNVSLLSLFRAGSLSLSAIHVLDWITVWWGRAGTVLCIEGCLAASLGTVPYMPVATTPSCDNQIYLQTFPSVPLDYKIIEKPWFIEILLIWKIVLYFKTVVLTDCGKPGKYRKC